MSRQLSNLRKKMERLQSRHAEGVARVRLAEDRLKKEFGCESLDEAVKLLNQLDEEIESEQAALDKDLEDFESKWGETLAEFD